MCATRCEVEFALKVELAAALGQTGGETNFRMALSGRADCSFRQQSGLPDSWSGSQWEWNWRTIRSHSQPSRQSVRHEFGDPRLATISSNRSGTIALVLMDRSVACIGSTPPNTPVPQGRCWPLQRGCAPGQLQRRIDRTDGARSETRLIQGCKGRAFAHDAAVRPPGCPAVFWAGGIRT